MFCIQPAVREVFTRVFYIHPDAMVLSGCSTYSLLSRGFLPGCSTHSLLSRGFLPGCSTYSLLSWRFLPGCSTYSLMPRFYPGFLHTACCRSFLTRVDVRQIYLGGCQGGFPGWMSGRFTRVDVREVYPGGCLFLFYQGAWQVLYPGGCQGGITGWMFVFVLPG